MTNPTNQVLTDEQIASIKLNYSNEFGLEDKHGIEFARAVIAALSAQEQPSVTSSADAVAEGLPPL